MSFLPEAYHLRREETDWFDKPRDGRSESGQEKRQVKIGERIFRNFQHICVLIHLVLNLIVSYECFQGKGPYYPFPHLRVKLQRDPKDRSVSGKTKGVVNHCNLGKPSGRESRIPRCKQLS